MWKKKGEKRAGESFVKRGVRAFIRRRELEAPLELRSSALPAACRRSTMCGPRSFKRERARVARRRTFTILVNKRARACARATPLSAACLHRR